MKDEDNAKDLREKRNQSRRLLLRQLGSLDVHVAEEDVHTVLASLDECKQLFTHVEQLHHRLVGESPPAKEDQFLASVREVYVNSVKAARAFINRQRMPTPASHAAGSTSAPLCELPRVELRPFSGNPAEYKLFTHIFDELVGDQPISNAKKMTRLLQYTRGEAYDAIKPCTYANDGYQQARAILEERFGDPHVLTTTFVRTLRGGKPVHTPSEFTHLADELRACCTTLKQTDTLSEVESQDLIFTIAKRLPPAAFLEWKKIAMSHKVETKRYPDFERFVAFVVSQARCESDPVYGETATSTQRPASTKRSFATQVESQSSQKEDRRRPRCPFCDASHKLLFCNRFKALDVASRIKFVDDHNLCQVCLMSNHSTANCKRAYECTECKQRHSRLLHVSEHPALVSNNCQANNSNARESRTSFIPSVQVKVGDSETFATAILDSGSNATFASREFLKRIGVEGKQVAYSLSTLHGTEPMRARVVNLVIHSTETPDCLMLTNVIETDVIPYASPVVSVHSFPHLKDLNFSLAKCQTADLLIGQDNATALIPFEIRRGQLNEPFAVRTMFGWSLNGPAGMLHRSHEVVSYFSFTALESNDEEGSNSLEQKIDRWWEFETNDYRPSDARAHSAQDLMVLAKWDATVERVDGRFQLPVPWRPGVDLPNNQQVAFHRLQSLKKNLHKRELFDAYDNEIQTLIAKGYAEFVPPNEVCNMHDLRVWYLPHHLVLNPKKPGKLRVVFDCAAKFGGQSLNDRCFSGPDLINRLTYVLFRFRQHIYAFTCDIEAMYYQVLIPPQDRNALRFLWYGRDGRLVHYRMTRHLFGGVWCGSSATYALRKSVEFDKSVSESVRDTIFRSFYVDDCLRSAQSADEARTVALETLRVLSNSGFNLTKFVSNSQDLIKALPDCKTVGDKEIGPADQSSVLGVVWNVSSDQFQFKCDARVVESITKRQMLSCITSVFDPLGMIAPIMVRGKVIFQQTSKMKLTWDEPVPDSLLPTWNQWQRDIMILDTLKIPRCIKPVIECTSELHHFSDASEDAYGCCSYLRNIDPSGRVSVHLLYSRSKVAPLKRISIPRLELEAATMAARADDVLRRELDFQIVQSHFWSDSQIVLQYIANESHRFLTYVANRVSLIRSLSSSEQWHHVSSKENVADIISRGRILTSNDKNRWFSGPTFLSLTDADLRPKLTSVQPRLIEDMETKKTATICAVNLEFENPIDKMSAHYSNFLALKKGIAWLLRFKDKLRQKRSDSPSGLTVQEMDHAESIIIAHVQRSTFSKEMASLSGGLSISPSSTIKKLDVFLDENGLLRVGGRLRRSTVAGFCPHPILVPHKHRVARLIAQLYHDHAHLGTEWVVSNIRAKYWITRARSIVKSVSSTCFNCRKMFSPPLQQKMADLPPQRALPYKAPFTYAGVDCFGPFLVKRARSEVKRYGCIFVCFNTRAVHLEMLDTMESDSFLNAFRRFASRRNYPEEIWSDNGKNFVGTQREMIREFGVDKSVKWNFNPPHASHMGGVWERLIRTVRKVLIAVVPKGARLNDETLRTLFCEVECIVNSRPITKVSTDVNDCAALTPNHLLTLRECPPMPSGTFSEADVFRRRWRCVQHIANMFWLKWMREYLPMLQKREKWCSPRRNLRVGDLVLVVDENAPRGVWPLALVIDVRLSSDGLVRSAKLRLASGVELCRPIHKLVFLEGSK